MWVKMEARCSSETLLLTRATWRHIPEDGIVQCYRQYAVNGVHFCGDENITAVISMYPLQVKHGQACGNKTCPPPPNLTLLMERRPSLQRNRSPFHFAAWEQESFRSSEQTSDLRDCTSDDPGFVVGLNEPTINRTNKPDGIVGVTRQASVLTINNKIIYKI
jgi:hypothetical protein